MATAMLDHGQYGIQVQGRAFTYDQLYRIKGSTAYHMNGTALTNNAWQSSYAQDNRYKETFTYDWNGNIQTVERYAGNTVAGTAVKSDGLTYQYAANSNLLVRINDTQNSCSYADDLDDQGNGTNYVYDAIGELTADNSERISSIEWTPYGKVKAVRKDQSKNMDACAGTEYDDADVEFLYTAGQQRLCKIVKPHKPNGAGIADQTEWIYYWYAYDAGGNVMGVYKQRFEDHGSNNYTVHLDLQEHGVYGSGRTGIRHADGKSDYYQNFTSTMTGGKFTSLSYTGSSSAYNHSHYERTIGYKQYEVTNHLGNVLVTVSDKRLPYAGGVSPTQVEWYTADVQSFTDYYVFGAPQTGRSGGSYRYGFNGKENDNEIKGVEGSSQDYGMRMYDPRVGRFFSADPLMIYYPFLTPYQFAGNMPILCIDLDGGEPKMPWHSGVPTRIPIRGTIWEWQVKNDHGSWVNVGRVTPPAPQKPNSTPPPASSNQTGPPVSTDPIPPTIAPPLKSPEGKKEVAINGTSTSGDAPAELSYGMQIMMAPPEDQWRLNPGVQMAEGTVDCVTHAVTRFGAAVVNGATYGYGDEVYGIPEKTATHLGYYRFNFDDGFVGMGYSRDESPSNSGDVSFQDGVSVLSGVVALIDFGMPSVRVYPTTKPRAFHSGVASEASALEAGYTTLGQTRAGKNLQNLIKAKNIPWEQARPMWARLSVVYAKQVPKGGTATVFLKNHSALGIWETVEKPILLDRGVRIIYK